MIVQRRDGDSYHNKCSAAQAKKTVQAPSTAKAATARIAVISRFNLASILCSGRGPEHPAALTVSMWVMTGHGKLTCDPALQSLHYRQNSAGALNCRRRWLPPPWPAGRRLALPLRGGVRDGHNNIIFHTRFATSSDRGARPCVVGCDNRGHLFGATASQLSGRHLNTGHRRAA